jgi:hypothetical protein
VVLCQLELWCIADNVAPDNYCTPLADGEKCTQCPNGEAPALRCVPDAPPFKLFPARVYHYQDYSPLYTPKYSGGIENLINLQEDWSGVTLRFSGTLSFTWLSERLETDYDLFYYAAPKRIFDYNEDLRIDFPPGTLDIISVVRKRWSRKS